LAITPLDDLEPAHAFEAGGKAWNCARLKQHGFPVPDGLVVPADASGVEIDALDRHPWFDRWPVDQRFAVRSSAIGEDGAEQSFAGIHESRLNVARCDVLAAVNICRASTGSERAKAYRRARSLSADAAAAGVLVQRMIQPLAAGVAFTIDPVTGAADEMVINATKGLGAALVDGQIDPDEIRVRKGDGIVLSYRVGAASGQPDGRSLPDHSVTELSALLVAVEGHYGSAQDVEWCYDGARFWIVQSRPITVKPLTLHDTEWTRANLAEVLPELTSPQALVAIEQMLNLAERRYMGRMLAPDEELGPIVKVFCGRLYFNLSQLRHICLMTGTAPADVLRSFGHAGDISPEDEVARQPPIGDAIRCLPDFVRVLSRHLRARHVMRAQEARMAAHMARFAPIDPAQLSDRQLWETLDEWQRKSHESLEAVLVFGGVLFHELRLRKICEKIQFPFERLLYSHLASGERSVSAQQAFDLVALADRARAEPRSAQWLLQTDGGVADMRAALHGTAFVAAFEQFLDQYGHRGQYESDWALPRYAEDPTPLLRAIRMHLRDGKDENRAAAIARLEADAVAARSEFEQRMIGWKRWTLRPRARRLLRTIKQYYVWREKCRSDMIRVVAVLRRWHLTLAARFAERGWLARPDDYFLLHLDEVGHVIRDPTRSGGLRDIASARAAEREGYAAIDMPMLMRESELSRLRRAELPMDGAADDREMRGVTVSRGSVVGEVVVIHDPGDFARMKRGAILVARATDPSWTPLFTLASGVIVEVGGVLSHASTIAREYGIPALANVRHATRRLRTGDRVELHATDGVVRKLA